MTLRLPAEDRALSPYTGWTRAHWEALADGLLRSALRWASPRGALLDLPGPASVSGVRSDGLEGYARTFLAAAFRVAGAHGADPHGHLPRYAEGLAAGTRTPGREDAESWPLVLDHTVQGQPMVESASVALGLRLTRPWLWDRLDERVRDRTEEWLRGALRHTPAGNNWYLFPFTVAGFLEDAGRGDAETARARTRALELLDGWYRHDGWYTDGEAPAYDHYNGWALHFYPLLDARLAGDTALSARYGPRLRAHLADAALLFGGDGAPVHFGRSLTYRFAAGAAVALGTVTGHTPLSPGTARRLLSGAARYFLDRGALDDDGLLTLGWRGPHPPTVQRYSGPASPYWASKAFAALLAPEDHPLWTAREEAAPSERGDRVAVLGGTGLLVQSTAADGLVRLHNHGSHRLPPHEGESPSAADPLYTRLAYSTRTGPTSADNLPDNHFSLALPGCAHSSRARIRPLGGAAADDWGWVASWHVPVFPAGAPHAPGLRVESVVLARGAEELRVHRVVGAPEGTAVRLTGWAVGEDGEHPPLRSELRGLAGWPSANSAWVRAPAGTAFTRWTRVPVLSGTVDGGGLFAAVASLSTGAGVRGTVVLPPAEPGEVRVRWGDGMRALVSFDPPGVRVTS